MKLKLTDLVIDVELQSRDKINDEVVQEYTEVIREGGKMPPVKVFFDGKKYYLTDGFHRYFAHKSAGFTDIEVTVIDGTRRDALLFCAGVNDDHGLRRTNNDKRKSVTILLDDFEWSEWSDREIARQCKVSHVFVSKVRKESANEDDASTPKKVKRGDTEYTMNTDNIGAKSQEQEPAEEYNEESEKLEEIATEFQAIAEENEELRAKLAVNLMDGTEEQKKEALETIEEQRERIKSLEAQVKGLTASRDAYQSKNAELLKQVNYWKKQAQK